MLIKTGKILLFCVIIAYAGELNFTASIDRTTVGTNEPLMLTVMVSGENIGSVPTPQLPNLPDFEIGGRSSSQSTNIQFINGKITNLQSISHRYTLYPKAVGEFTIGACKIEYKGETYKTQPITITVVQGSAPPPPTPGPAPSEPSVPIDDNLKIIATVNRRSAYVGEQISVDFSFYTRVRLSDAGITELPTYSGFWAETVFEPKRWEFQNKTVNEEVYSVCVLRKVALFPMTSGSLKISPMKMDVAIVQPPRDFFDMWGTTKVVPLASNQITVTVKPLPDGKPEEFTGGVGQFSLVSSLDRDTSRAAEPIYFTLRINGSGNIRLIEKPIIPPIPGVKILDPEVKDDINTSGSLINGYKEFRYPLIPQMDGEHIVPSVKIAYFNPRDKTYHTLKTEKRNFIATQTASAVQAVQTDGLKVLGSDINYIKAHRTHIGSRHAYASWWLVVFYIGGIAVVISSIAYRKHQARLLTDRAYARKLHASRTVRKYLKVAERFLKHNSIPEFLDMLSRVLLGYIGDRYNLDTGILTKEQLIQNLRQEKVEDEVLEELDNILHQCDVVRYSPGMACDAPEKVLKRTKEILSRL